MKPSKKAIQDAAGPILNLRPWHFPPIKTRAEHLSFGSCFISLIELKTDIGNPTAPLWPAPTLQ